ncbi:hypothetical protein GCM10009632_17950 [Mycolicibacterium alvei]|jgi:Cu2+-exporting ATPase|uniref:Uncharacterized protein n=1 Tax=Mycolicibacterium alvei TaxID=67081 RepID=A0A6N4UXJ3_9MYCO|nr:hypothetical protein MALV_38000 [Mycolicibacterium alvei]
MHEGHGDRVTPFRRLLWVMTVPAVPTVAHPPMSAMLLGYSIPDFPGATWIPPLLGTVMHSWGGRSFLAGAVSEMRSCTTVMELSIGLAITVSFVASWGAGLGVLHHQLDLWWGPSWHATRSRCADSTCALRPACAALCGSRGVDKAILRI